MAVVAKEALIHAPLEKVFGLAVLKPEDRWRTVKTKIQVSSSWPRPGATLMVLSRNTVVVEVLEHAPPTRHVEDVKGWGKVTWSFLPEGTDTRVRLEVYYKDTMWPFRPMDWILQAPSWRRELGQILEGLKLRAEGLR
ncbi:MAG: hypothetical protein HYU29_02430 [Chloroflexi bacterium]|nr:hypothetical protein [Chloroflexota bacterium]